MLYFCGAIVVASINGESNVEESTVNNIEKYTNEIEVSNEPTDIIKDNIKKSSNNNQSLDKVTMSIKNDSISKTSLILEITDLNEEPYYWGRWFRIDKKENDIWSEVEQEQISTFTADAVSNKTGKLELEVNWRSIYGQLEAGEYRVVKILDNTELYCEFEIK